MRAHVITTGAIFGLIILAHVWRVIEEGPGLMTDLTFVFTTVVSVALCLWALRLARHSTGP